MPVQMYLSTLSPNAPALAEKYSLGLELTQFCTAMNMDENFDVWDQSVRECMKSAEKFVLHAPFAELTPCAIDPLVKRVSLHRLKQAADLCARYGVRRMVVHSGFVPNVYFPVWYLDQGVPFFQELLSNLPDDFELLIENVLDPTPDLLFSLIERIDDPRARVCLDVGHAFCVSKVPLGDWLNALSPFIAHLHLHDNDSTFDAHLAPGCGKIGYPAFFDVLEETVPRATWTFECPDADRCIQKLVEFGKIG